MAAGRLEIEIPATPDAVWATVGDFGAAGDFLPGIDAFRLEGDERVIGMFGLEIRERLVERDEAGRSITYSLIDGVPIERHQATISVEAGGDGSVVAWAFEVEPDEMAPLFADTYQKALEALRSVFSG
jgi:carbon monoxide dehydrogenase subunit G